MRSRGLDRSLPLETKPWTILYVASGVVTDGQNGDLDGADHWCRASVSNTGFADRKYRHDEHLVVSRRECVRLAMRTKPSCTRNVREPPPLPRTRRAAASGESPGCSRLVTLARNRVARAVVFAEGFSFCPIMRYSAWRWTSKARASGSPHH